jgi:4'-phosphopantetheinyl transferase
MPGSRFSSSMFSPPMLAGAKVEVRECCELGETCIIPDLQRDVVSVWIRSLQVAPAIEQSCYELLSAQECERAARYRAGRPRNDFVLTRGTLRFLLARYLGTTPQALSFRYSKHGKPVLDGFHDRSSDDGLFDLRFNVSHTDGLALLAFVRKREIGIDVEKIHAVPDMRKLVERFFSLHERDSLEKLSGEELPAAFFRCWTRKEAYVKARGEGLSLPLHQFDVSVAAEVSQALLATRPDASEASRWIVHDLPAGQGYAAAVAVGQTVGE